MEAEIDLNHALLVVGIAAACLCLFFLMMVCFLSPHCPLNRCVPCAPRYDELDEYEEDPKSKQVTPQKSIKRYEALTLQSIQEVSQDNGNGKVESEVDEEVFADSLDDKPEKPIEKQSLMVAQARTLKQYLSFESSQSSTTSGGQSASDESSSESGLLYLPLKKSSVDFTMLWDKEAHSLTVEITKLKCNFSKFAKVNDNVTMKLQLAQNPSTMQNIFSVFQKEEDLKKNLIMEAQTSVKKRKREILFNEKIGMIVTSENLDEFTLRLLICTVDKDDVVENVGEAMVPLKTLESSTSLSTTMVLQPLPKEAKGEVLVSLSYLPTAEKLSVIIMQVNNVTSYKKTGESEFFVKMAIVSKGKALQKKRTESHPAANHVQINETHILDLPIKHIDKTSLVISLKETQRGKWIAGEDVTVGKCILNARSEDLNASGHWKEVFLNSRTAVVKWQFFR